MRESRLSLYSLFLFIFAYMVSLMLYNIAWTNESLRFTSRLGSTRQSGGMSSSHDRRVKKRYRNQDARKRQRHEVQDQVESQQEGSESIIIRQGVGSDEEENYSYGETRKTFWDPQDLLDFAVVDLDETVADAVTAWLSEHPRIEMLSFRDDHTESASNPFTLIEEVQSHVEEEGKKVIRGYRVDLDDDKEFDALRTFWPKTKLVVVLRHPVRWFEDFYNRYIETSSTPLMHPNRLIGPCSRLGQTVCTDKADVAFPLLKLGKTMKDPTSRTRQIVKENRLRQNLFGAKIPMHPNPVFLVTWEQLMETDAEKQRKLVSDLEYFLGVRSDLPFLRLPLEERLSKKNMHIDPHIRTIDICESSFRPLRKALLDIGRRSSQWIRDDFLSTTTVTCSQVDWLAENLKAWMDDPCLVAKETTSI